MLPLPRSGYFYSCICFLCICFVVLLLGGCSDSTNRTPIPATPATQLPAGTLTLASGDSTPRSQDQAVEAISTFAARAGVDFHQLQNNGEPLAALLRIDLRRFEPRVVAAPPGQKKSKAKLSTKGVSPAAAISATDVAVVVGSSFVSQVRLMQPLGVLQVNNTLLQTVEPHGYTRILGIQKTPAGKRFAVAHRSEWPVERFSSALQAGPGIIEHGALDISQRDLRRQKYFRSFVAACGEYSVVGTTLVPTHLYTLGTALVGFFTDNDWACDEVVNLAGDRESVLLLRSEGEVAYLGNPVPTKAGLIAFKRLQGN